MLNSSPFPPDTTHAHKHIHAGQERITRGFRALAFLLPSALLSGCDNYNLLFNDFYEGKMDGVPLAFASDKAITAFSFDSITPPAAGAINEEAKTIAVTVPCNTGVGRLTPTIAHTGASITPLSGEEQDFSGTVAYTVTAADGSAEIYTVTVNVAPALTATAAVTDYLNDATGGTSAADPVLLSVDITLDAAGWAGLLAAIAAAGLPKYVDLDLSDCDKGTHSSGGGFHSSGTFDPGTAASAYIVSLVLPDAATSIPAGSSSSHSAFRNFTVLKNISGKNIQSIGNYAFDNCTALATADFPAATYVSDYAFRNCTALTTVSLRAATCIEIAAFQNCTALATVSLPEVTYVGLYAFRYCTGLTTVSLPKATYIGVQAFDNCIALETVNLPAGPPTLGSSVFNYTLGGSGPGITIHVASPGTVTGYTSAWSVAADTAANGNTGKYGSNHNAVSIVTP